MTPIAKLVNAEWFDPKRFAIFQMGGSLTGKEYNFKGDIEAARTVLQKGKEVHWIHSGTTFQEGMAVKEGNPVFKKMTTLLPRLSELMKNNYDSFRKAYGDRGYYPYLSDAVAMISMENECVTFAEKRMTLSDSGQIVEDAEGVATFVSQGVDIPTFIETLMKRMDQMDEPP